MKKGILLTALIIGLMVTTMSSVALAQTETANVTIGYPSSPSDLGFTSGSYWIGQFPITVAMSNGTTNNGEAYCLTYDGTVNEGSSYPANITPVDDTATWRAISFILSWYPATDGNSAAIDQDAIWRVLGGYETPNDLGLSTDIENAGAALAAEATGKNVVRAGDQLNWVSPNAGITPANAGQTVAFQVQITDSSGNPRPNVQIDFNATLQPPSGPGITLDSSYFNSTGAFTDSNGFAGVAVTVPSNALDGSTITVQASTQSVWPEEYLDLVSGTSTAQNLIGATPALNLTITTNIDVLGYIMVMPESALGSLSAVVAFAAAFIIYTKVKRPKK